MYCRKCGTEQKEGQKFCPNCGTPFLEGSGTQDGMKTDVLGILKKHKLALAIGIAALFLVFLLVKGCGKDGTDSDSVLSSSREICVSLDVTTDYQKVVSCRGSHGAMYDDVHFFSDDIVVPNGKTWTFIRDEYSRESGGNIPSAWVYYFREENVKGPYKSWNTRRDGRLIPTFRGGDMIRVFFPRWMGVSDTMHAKVYFKEENDL